MSVRKTEGMELLELEDVLSRWRRSYVSSDSMFGFFLASVDAVRNGLPNEKVVNVSVTGKKVTKKLN